MRHKRLNKRFGRSKSARKELVRSLARNAIIYQRIKTTLPKAKEAARLVNRLISLGKEETLQARRAAFDILQDKTLVSRLVKDIAPLFKNRNGGYTRIIQLNTRHGDGAQMAILELAEIIKKEPKPKKAKARAQEPQKVSAEPQKEMPEVAPSEKAKPPKPEEKKPKEEKPKAEKPKPKEKKPKEKKAEPKKEGLFGRLKGLFRRGKP